MNSQVCLVMEWVSAHGLVQSLTWAGVTVLTVQNPQVLCWVCLLALFTCMYVVCASLSAQWFMKTNFNSSQGRTRSLLDCETANSAMPTCSSAEKCKHGFCKSLQTHNPNHNMVITLQLFWIKWARTHQHRSLKHRKQSCVAYDIL